MSNSASQQPHRLIAHPIDQWGVHDNPNVGMVIGADSTGERFNLIAVAPDGTVGSAAFQNREDAETAVKLINNTLDSPATGRMGGPFVVYRKGKFKQGIRWVGFDLKVVDGQPAPDTDNPRAVVWLLPASDEKSVALVDTRDPQNYRPIGFFFTTEAANAFVDTMDAIVTSISESAD
ncbi:MAG TPA: hypothetical protein VIG82_11775 [Enteractinococcus sp.]